MGIKRIMGDGKARLGNDMKRMGRHEMSHLTHLLLEILAVFCISITMPAGAN